MSLVTQAYTLDMGKPEPSRLETAAWWKNRWRWTWLQRHAENRARDGKILKQNVSWRLYFIFALIIPTKSSNEKWNRKSKVWQPRLFDENLNFTQNFSFIECESKFSGWWKKFQLRRRAKYVYNFKRTPLTRSRVCAFFVKGHGHIL